MATLTSYATGLFSANARGKAFMDGTVTRLTWRGPPIVAVFLGEAPLSSSLPALDAVVAFAALFDAPLVAIDQGDAGAAAVLLAAHRRYGGFFDYRGVGPTKPDNVTPVVLSGPWLGVGTTAPNRTGSAQLAWATAQDYNRTTQFHPYGLGMQAVSQFNRSTGYMAPPVYLVGTDVAGDLGRLADRWLRRVAPTPTAVQTVYDAQAGGRPGLARLVNPVLVPYVALAYPT